MWLSFLVPLLLRFSFFFFFFFYWPYNFFILFDRFISIRLSMFEIIRFVRRMQFCHLTWLLVWNESISCTLHLANFRNSIATNGGNDPLFQNYRSQWWMIEWKMIDLSLLCLNHCPLNEYNNKKKIDPRDS